MTSRDTATREQAEYMPDIDPLIMEVVANSMPEEWRDRIRSFWDPRVVRVALLAPPRVETCETCGGHGEVLGYFGPHRDHGVCPDCGGNGQVLGAPLMVLTERLEQVGWIDHDDGDLLPAASYDGPRSDDWTCTYSDPVYRLVAEEDRT